MLIAHTLRLLGFPRPPRKPSVEQRLAAINWPTLDWQFATSWAGERREIAPGFDLSREDWRAIADPGTGNQRQIDVRDPLYGSERQIWLWFIERDGEMLVFAAGEASNGVWLVFLPDGAGPTSSLAAEAE